MPGAATRAMRAMGPASSSPTLRSGVQYGVPGNPQPEDEVSRLRFQFRKSDGSRENLINALRSILAAFQHNDAASDSAT